MQKKPLIRLAKFLANAGIASRRVAETYIQEGLVTVNGEKVTTPAINIKPEDVVHYKGRIIQANPPQRLWRYYKPTGLVCTHHDPQGRPTVLEKIRPLLPKGISHIMTIGRLDLNSEGLLLLTNDGDLSRALELPSTGWKRRYKIRVHGHVKQNELDTLSKGITVQGVHYREIQATIERQQGDNSWLMVTLVEGKNREIRRVMAHLGYPVNRLLRLSYGPFQLGNLQKGTLEEVPSKTLKEQLGTLNKNP